METYKTVPDHPEFEISDLGNVRKSGQLQSLSKTSSGHLYFRLHKPGEVESLRVHRVVWEVFRGKIPEGFVVHHKDRNKTNNRIDNLKVQSRSRHARLHGKDYRKKKEPKTLSPDEELTKALSSISAKSP